MASLSTDKKTGVRRILFVDEGTRRTIRLGKMPKKAAESVLARVEHLIAARTAGVAIDADTARWLSDLPETLHAKLVVAGLAQHREQKSNPTIKELLDAYEEARNGELKDRTRSRQNQVRRYLLDHFSPDRKAREITAIEAEQWRKALLDGECGRRYARSTVSKAVKTARQFFKWGIKQGLVGENPFKEIRAGAEVNRDRLALVDRQAITRVMDAAPSLQWRLLIALSRFSGLRVPSEAFLLR